MVLFALSLEDVGDGSYGMEFGRSWMSLMHRVWGQCGIVEPAGVDDMQTRAGI